MGTVETELILEALLDGGVTYAVCRAPCMYGLRALCCCTQSAVLELEEVVEDPPEEVEPKEVDWVNRLRILLGAAVR